MTLCAIVLLKIQMCNKYLHFPIMSNLVKRKRFYVSYLRESLFSEEKIFQFNGCVPEINKHWQILPSSLRNGSFFLLHSIKQLGIE